MPPAATCTTAVPLRRGHVPFVCSTATRLGLREHERRPLSWYGPALTPNRLFPGDWAMGLQMMQASVPPAVPVFFLVYSSPFSG